MYPQMLRSLLVCVALFAGSVAVFGPAAYAQSGEEPTKSEDVGPWKVACTRDAVYNYTFCNTFQTRTLGDGADDFVRFGVTRSLGSERVGVNLLNGFASDSTVMISVDKAHHWQFPATGNIAMLASPSESRKIIALLRDGKSVQLRFTPAGGAEQQVEMSLERFAEALERARTHAK
jgi:invasion protein IalB